MLQEKKNSMMFASKLNDATLGKVIEFVPVKKSKNRNFPTDLKYLKMSQWEQNWKWRNRVEKKHAGHEPTNLKFWINEEVWPQNPFEVVVNNSEESINDSKRKLDEIKQLSSQQPQFPPSNVNLEDLHLVSIFSFKLWLYLC